MLKKPRLWHYLAGALATLAGAVELLGPEGDLSPQRIWLHAAVGFVAGAAIGCLWVNFYRRRLRFYLLQPWEFDCPECGRHILRFSRLDERRCCAECLAIPGWFRDPTLVRILDPLMLGREETITPARGDEHGG